MPGRGLRRFTDTNTDTEPFPLKYGKLARKYPSMYGYFYSVWIETYKATAESIDLVQ